MAIQKNGVQIVPYVSTEHLVLYEVQKNSVAVQIPIKQYRFLNSSTDNLIHSLSYMAVQRLVYKPILYFVC